MQKKQNWTANLSLEDLTQEQVNELTLLIVEYCEKQGGYAAGGFAPQAEEDGQDGAQQQDHA